MFMFFQYYEYEGLPKKREKLFSCKIFLIPFNWKYFITYFLSDEQYI